MKSIVERLQEEAASGRESWRDKTIAPFCHYVYGKYREKNLFIPSEPADSEILKAFSHDEIETMYARYTMERDHDDPD